MPDQPEALAQFRAAYGRLCVLTAKALKQGHPQRHVEEAVKGKGRDVAPVYVLLRSQRALVKRLIEQVNDAGMPVSEISPICREIRALVESEWMLELPLFAEVT
jgi:hypothetical protein